MNRTVRAEPHDETATGDYSAMVEKLNGTPPGKVHDKPRQAPAPGYDVTPWFLALLQSCVFGALSYLALSERVITLGGRHGGHFYEGVAAVWIGFALLAGAMLVLLKPIRRSRLFLPVGLFFVAAWVAIVVRYFAA